MSAKIFLSTVSDEFRAYRDQLRSDLTRHNVEVKVQEDFKDLGGDTLDKLDVYIAHCDAVVHLAGDMTGSDPGEHELGALRVKYPDLADKLPPLGEAVRNGSGVSYTQWEAWLALYHGKLLFIAEAADSAERGPKYVQTDASRAAQAAHLARLKAMGRYPGCTFASPDDLAKHILSSAILDLLVNAEKAEVIAHPRARSLVDAGKSGLARATLGLAVTMLGAAAAFWPRMTVVSSGLFDATNAYSESFTVTNTGFIQLSHVDISIGLCFIKTEKKDVEVVKSTVGCGIPATRYSKPKWTGHNLVRDEQLTITLSDLFDVKTDRYVEENPGLVFSFKMFSSLEGADIIIIIVYQPWFLPIKFEKGFRFVAEMQPNDRVMWKPRPLDTGVASPFPLQDGQVAYRLGDYAAAMRYWRPLAEQGNSVAQVNLGVMYAQGQGVPQDYAQAVAWFRKAADQGNALGQVALGNTYRSGAGVPQDYAQAVAWYRKAADQGNAVGLGNLGLAYAQGQGVPQDHAQAAVWLRKAADQGYAPGQVNLGLAYALGQGVSKDAAQAVAWFRKAADQGNAPGQVNLGLAYANGQGVPLDSVEAVAWFRKAADQGYAPGQENLGLAYAQGQGVQQDSAEAVAWYRKAADQGYAPGQVNLGFAYAQGQGVLQDSAQAVAWFRRAADQGDALGQYNLGDLYSQGWGVPQDYAQAVAWYRKSADQGNAVGQVALGRMYVDGHGVPQSYIVAYMWFNLAVSRATNTATRDLAAKNRDEVAVKMTPDQIAEAQRLAREWKPK